MGESFSVVFSYFCKKQGNGIIFSIKYYHSLIKILNMRYILFLLAGLFFAGWLLGCFVLKAGFYIHILVLMSAIFCLQAIIVNPKSGRSFIKIK